MSIRRHVLNPTYYIVLYRVLDETRIVEILRVKHTARRTP